jgi:gamma-glutamyl-gamma-aminobutyrate hydrolase PuuD
MELKVLINSNLDNSSYIKLLEYSFSKIKVIPYRKDCDFEKPDLTLFTGGEDVDPKFYRHSRNSKTGSNIKRDEFESAMYNYSMLRNIPCLGICRGSQFLTVMNGGKLFQHVTNHTKDHLISVHKKYFPNKKKEVILNNPLLPPQLQPNPLRGIHEQLRTPAEEIQERFLNNNDPFSEINLIEIQVTSTHHQMMNPYNLRDDNYEIIGFSTYHQSDVYEESFPVSLNEKKYEKFVEPEIVFYKNTKSLAIQGHPEFKHSSDEFKELTLELINKLLLK